MVRMTARISLKDREIDPLIPEMRKVDLQDSSSEIGQREGAAALPPVTNASLKDVTYWRQSASRATVRPGCDLGTGCHHRVWEPGESRARLVDPPYHSLLLPGVARPSWAGPHTGDPMLSRVHFTSIEYDMTRRARAVQP
jgi:hypothetical protein